MQMAAKAPEQGAAEPTTPALPAQRDGNLQPVPQQQPSAIAAALVIPASLPREQQAAVRFHEMAPTQQPVIAGDMAVVGSGQPQPSASQAISPNSPAPALASDFSQIVDRLVEAREMAGRHVATMQVHNADFGRVDLRFEENAGRLSITMANADPDFARTVSAASPPPAEQQRGSDPQAPAPQRFGQQDTAAQQQQNQPQGRQPQGEQPAQRFSPATAQSDRADKTTPEGGQRNGIYA